MRELEFAPPVMPILSWLNRDEDIRAAGRAPYRLLEEVSEHGAGDRDAGNMLIQGDNLDALKALLPFYAGQAKCIYIDPPYNTRSAVSAHYEDNLKHSQWLAMITPRLEFMSELLSPDGSLFIHLDDNELDYCKVVADEIFGRNNFVQRISIKVRAPSAFSTVNKGVFKSSEYLLWYAKDRSKMVQNRLWVRRAPDLAYDKLITNFEAAFTEWRIEPAQPYLKRELQKETSIKTDVVERFYVENCSRLVRFAEIDDDGAGQDIIATKSKSRFKPAVIFKHERIGHGPIYIMNGQQLLFYEKNVRLIDGRLTPSRMLTNIWDDVPWEGISSEGGVRFPRSKKPERLLRRCIDLCTVPGDLVLDSFLGSGTAAAVALKMGRRFIGIEMGDHAISLCAPRLTRVVEGEQSGISKLVKWKGGSGFRFYTLGRPAFDAEGRIDPAIRFPSLAAHVWFSETGRPWSGKGKSPLLGVNGERAVALLYNGILGDKTPNGGNVLNRATLALIKERLARKAPSFDGDLVIYGEVSGLGPRTLERERIVFRQTPYDVKARR